MLRRILSFFLRRRSDREFASEIQDHLALLKDRYIRQGMTAQEAEYAARRQFGGIAQLQETRRDRAGFPSLEHAIKDVTYGLRALLRNPGYTAVAALSLALGIGVNTAIYCVTNALFLRSLPIADPERLVMVTIPLIKRGEVIFGQSFSYPQYRNLRDHSRQLEGVLCFRTHFLSVTTGAVTERISGAAISGNYFQLLGVRPVLGTAIEPSDDVTPGSGGTRGPVAVVSHKFWQRRLGANPSVIGQTIEINGHQFTIIGVAPPHFSGTDAGEAPDVYAAMMMQSALMPENRNALEQRRNVWLRVMGRLKPGGDPRQAEAELSLLQQQFRQEDLSRMKDVSPERRRAMMEQRIALLPGATGTFGLRRQFGTLVAILTVVAGVVLLISCANVANLSLARAAGRQREIAVRLALGATRRRLISLLLSETLLLALAGTVLGLLLARWARDLLVRALVTTQHLDASIDWRVLAAAIAMGAAAGILCGLAPALQAGRSGLTQALKMESAAFRGRFPLRSALVAVQVALSVILLIAAGLFLRTLLNLRSVDPGFNRQNIVLASTDPELSGYSTERARLYYRNLLEAARAIPGVRLASMADSSPLDNHTFWDIYVPHSREQLSAQVTQIADGYFEMMNIRLLLGRDISVQDRDGSPRVAIVNETFARTFFPNENAIGQRFGSARGEFNIEIIGVAQDSKYQGLREPAPQPMLYVPFTQNHLFAPMIVHARTGAHPATVIAALREQVRRLDPKMPVYNVRTVEEQIDLALAEENLMATVAGLFGFLAVALSAAGVYGVMAFAVSRRAREVGIRVALGAASGAIHRMMLRDAALLVAAGVVVGVPVAYALARLAASRFFGVTPGDAVSIVLAVGTLSVAALLAAWIPARRAARVDPIQALRAE
jgi:predicted permease